MFSYLYGIVDDIFDNGLSISVNNIGFLVKTKNNECYKLKEKIKLYIYDVIKENELVLYGFKEYKDLKMFQKLILVNGIGEKIAINILSSIETERLIYLIKTRNKNELKKIQNIGIRAESIIVTLYRKIDDDSYQLFPYKNVLEALKSLGYKEDKINDILIKLPDNLNDSDALKYALRELKK